MKKQKPKTLDQVIGQTTNSLVDFLMMDVAIDKKQTPYLTESKVHHDLFELLAATDIRNRITHAIRLIRTDLKGHLGQEELAQVNQEFSRAAEIIISMLQEKHPVEESIEKLSAMPDHLQGILKISEQSFHYFYQCGERLFNTTHFKDARDVFFLLTLLNPYKYNVWIASGLAEKRFGDNNKALEAFAMAALLDLSSVFSHLYSAECYRDLHDNTNAVISLETALSVVTEHPQPDDQKIREHIHSLINKYKG